jgi:hypothetical protein
MLWRRQVAIALEIPRRYLSLAPVIVTSPTTRCGTTLIQRLLCASDNAFIYGEEIGNQFRMLGSLLAHQVQVCDAAGDAVDEDFCRALIGELKRWQPGLRPPGQVLIDALTETFFQLPQRLAGFGDTIGRPIWGFKWPGCPPETLHLFLALMPQARIVYALRNPADALRSAKARRFVRSTEDAAAFCGQWAQHVTAMAPWADDPRVMVLRYEDLVDRDRAGQMARLQAFTGVTGVRGGEFDLKVNTFEGDERDGHSPLGYIAPEPLTDDDRAVLRAEAGLAMAPHYPELEPEAA